MAGKLSQILNDPEMMEKIRGLSGLLGQDGPPEPEGSTGSREREEHSGPEHRHEEEPNAPSNPVNATPALGSLLSGDTMQTMMKLAPLLSKMNQEDDSTRFLHALRPLLSPPRQAKLDEASKMLQLMRMLPLLRGSGIL